MSDKLYNLPDTLQAERRRKQMAVVQNLYQIFKLPASLLVANDCNIEQYTITRGLKEGNIVSIGDNIIFQQLRYIHNDYRDHKELFNYVQKLRASEHSYKKEGKYKEAHILNRHITDVLFVMISIMFIYVADLDKFVEIPLLLLTKPIMIVLLKQLIVV